MWMSMQLFHHQLKVADGSERALRGGVGMKNFLILGIIMLVAVPAWAQSDDTVTPPPAESAVEAPPITPKQRPMNQLAVVTLHGRFRQKASQSQTGQNVMTSPKSNDKSAVPVLPQNQLITSNNKSAVPVLPQNQLIQNLLLPANEALPKTSSQSNKNNPQPQGVFAPPKSRIVVCVVDGFEQKNMTSADCNAKGGRITVISEVTNKK